MYVEAHIFEPLRNISRTQKSSNVAPYITIVKKEKKNNNGRKHRCPIKSICEDKKSSPFSRLVMFRGQKKQTEQIWDVSNRMMVSQDWLP